MDKQDVLKELEKEFLTLKKSLGFDFDLEDLDREFFIKNVILDAGYVPTNLSRAISSVIASKYRDWSSYLNGLLIPNSGFYASQTESKLFNSEKQRNEIWELLKKSMKFSSESSIANITLDESLIKNFIISSYNYWVKEFKPSLLKILKKVNGAWSE